MDTLQHSESDHPQFILTSLNQFRLMEPKLCDFLIHVDGTSFPCHRAVLCIFSSFFKAAIHGQFREDAENCVCLKDVSSSDIKVILDYFYTGSISLNHSNVENLLKIASKLEIAKVAVLCLDYLRHQIDYTNCLDILRFAKENNYQMLQVSARQYLHEHLSSVFQYEAPQNEILLNDVTTLLQDAEAHKQGEELVAMTVMTWLHTDIERRREHASYLLDHVCWRMLSAPFLLKVLLRHPLLNKDAEVKSIVLQRVRRSYDENEESEINDLTFNQNNAFKQNQDVTLFEREKTFDIFSSKTLIPCLQSKLRQGLLLIGGLTLGEAERGDTTQDNVMSYNPITREWRSRAAWPERGLRGFSVARLNKNVVVSGGCSTSGSKHIVTKRSWIYHVAADEWRQLPDMKKPRAFHSSCQLLSQLYSIGGAVGNRLDVEVFDEFQATWTEVKKPAPRMMYNFTGTACNAKLIVIGNGVASTIFLQCYNPAVDSWSVTRSPNVPRHLSSPVCVTASDESKIFATGDNTRKLYIFDPNINSWSRASDMNNLHSNGNLILLGKQLIHTGGHWEEDGYWDEMESYNIANNTWMSLGALPHLWLYHGCAAVFMSE